MRGCCGFEKRLQMVVDGNDAYSVPAASRKEMS